MSEREAEPMPLVPETLLFSFHWIFSIPRPFLPFSTKFLDTAVKCGLLAGQKQDDKKPRFAHQSLHHIW